jgi:hypothetical protein
MLNPTTDLASSSGISLPTSVSASSGGEQSCSTGTTDWYRGSGIRKRTGFTTEVLWSLSTSMVDGLSSTDDVSIVI